MRLGSLLSHISARWVRRLKSGERLHRKRGRRRAFAIEGLESRRPLSATPLAAPAVIMNSATTADSWSVSIEYDLNISLSADQPLNFGVYRSADDRFDASDIAAGELAIVPPGQGSQPPTLDLLGQTATAAGRHQLTIPVPGGLPPMPERPYVLVVADPAAALASGDPGAAPSASFRTHVIGVVTHGGIQNKQWKNGPPWQLVLGHILRREGYDVVIPFNWVSESDDPGEAARQAPRLARMVRNAASRFPASDPVDLHIIGHSEGTVVNSRAIILLGEKEPPQLQAGYLKVTMLDPHAANSSLPGQQYSVSDGPLGWLAKGIIDAYQSDAKDPVVVVSPGVDDAEVFYQHTPASRTDSNDKVYNLWGQVPVRGPAHYFNLTGIGATHSGKTGVAAWYRRNVAPLLGEGAPEVQARILTGALDPDSVAPGANAGHVTHDHRPVLSGTALPGSTVFVFGGPAGSPSELWPIGRTVVDPDGQWRAATRRLPDGRYRVLAVAVPPRPLDEPRLAMLPTAPLGLMVVNTQPGA